jgi:rhodanese-related sulfurtransferase
MEPVRNRTAGSGDRSGLLPGALAILGTGVVLGLAYNAMGLASRPVWGLAWIGVERGEAVALESLGSPAADEGGTAIAEDDAAVFATDVNDPMAIAVAPARASEPLPVIPELDRPINIQLDATKRLFDHRAAVFVDAREADEYDEGHIPGALSMPYDEVSSDPGRLERLDAGGRPIIVYCGGGACELSRDLAWDLLYAGHSRVTVYEGGFPEWQEAGYPVAKGIEGGAEG